MKKSSVFIALLICSALQAVPPPGHPTTAQAAELLGMSATSMMAYSGEVVDNSTSNPTEYDRSAAIAFLQQLPIV